MKILKRTESKLIIGERGLNTRHLGIFFFLIGGGAFTALTLDGDDLSLIIKIALIGFAGLGLFAAIFMGKQLTHRLEKISGKIRIEYPELMETRLSIEEFRISDVRAIRKVKQDSLQQMLTRSTDLPGGKMSYAANGFSYILKSGKVVEGGIFSSVTKEIDAIINALSEFMDVPVE